MKTLLSLALLCFFGLQLVGQTDTVENALPKNMISIAPINQPLFGTTNMIYYKRLIQEHSGNFLFARLDFGYLDRLTNNRDDNLLVDPVSPDRRSLNVFFGLEWYKRFGNFSLIYGAELGFTNYSFFEELISVNNGSVFSNDGLLTITQEFAVNDSYYRSFNLVGFIGFSYHIGQHFQVGLESALGWSLYRLENDFVSGIVSTNRQATGTIRELAVGRNLVLEVNF